MAVCIHSKRNVTYMGGDLGGGRSPKFEVERTESLLSLPIFHIYVIKLISMLKYYHYTMEISKILKLGWVKMLPLHNGNSHNFRVGMGLSTITLWKLKNLLWKEVKMLPLHCGNSTNLKVGGVKML